MLLKIIYEEMIAKNGITKLKTKKVARYTIFTSLHMKLYEGSN